MARYFRVKPNELANRMIAAGILALEREDPDYEPDFVVEYRQKVIIPKIEQYQSEKKLAESFNLYSDVPKELESDGWAFVGLIEGTNLHYRELVDGLLERKSVERTFSYISRDTTLSHAYLDKLKSIYASPAYQECSLGTMSFLSSGRMRIKPMSAIAVSFFPMAEFAMTRTALQPMPSWSRSSSGTSKTRQQCPVPKQ